MRTLALLLLCATACSPTEPNSSDSDPVTESESDEAESSDTDPAVDTDTASAEDTGDGLCDVAWAEVPFDGREAWMAACVMPPMIALFEAYDAEAYADLDCSSCHGSGVTDGTYRMPGIVGVDFNDRDSWEDGIEDFMQDEVKTLMGDLLGIGRYDPKTNTGVGCKSCHF